MQKSQLVTLTWSLRTMPLEDLHDLENNPRLISEQEFEQLKTSVQKFGLIDKPCVNVDGTIIGGHRRTDVYRAYGLTEIEVWWPSRRLTLEEVRELNIRLNRNTGDWDWEKLGAMNPNDLIDWGFDPEDLGIGFEPEEPDQVPEPQIDRAEELQKKWGTESGQLWTIGRHRLLCGDATNPEDVERLLNGATPRLMITDPPYGVEYDPSWRTEAMPSRGARRTGKVANDDRVDWTEAWLLSPSHVVYCWHAGLFAPEVKRSLEQSGFEIRSQIIWAKDHFAISRGAYHWQHEPCWYGVRKGHNAEWIGDRSQSTLWEIPVRDDDDQKSHGTQKPAECMERPIRNHSGDVYEPFCGSGTTIAAAERQARSCFAIDVDPKYVAVTIERLVQMGLEASLL